MSSNPISDPGKTPVRWRSRALGGAATLAVHVMVLAALFWPHAAPPSRPRESSLMLVRLPESPRPSGATGAKSDSLPDAVHPVPPHPAMPVLIVNALASDTSDVLSDSQLAGAARAGESDGGGGGSCDIARALQQALRRDPLVRAAVENANRAGRAIMLWNGDWVQSGGQDGKGLSAVREAIMWEVAFAPEACRNTRMHGMVLLSLADGNTRFAIGSGDWRWSDLLFAHGTAR